MDIFKHQPFPQGFWWFSRKIRIPGFRMEMETTPSWVFKTKFNHQGTADLSPFHLPGFYFGVTPVLTHRSVVSAKSPSPGGCCWSPGPCGPCPRCPQCPGCGALEDLRRSDSSDLGVPSDNHTLPSPRQFLWKLPDSLEDKRLHLSRALWELPCSLREFLRDWGQTETSAML